MTFNKTPSSKNNNNNQKMKLFENSLNLNDNNSF